MPRDPRPPVAAAVSFVDAINCQDPTRLGRLMTDDHRLLVFDEATVVGRDTNLEAWAGYFSAFPDYVIHPIQFVEGDGTVAVLGSTTGSHLRLPDEQERQETLIWLATVVDGRLTEWRLVDDTPEARRQHGLTTLPA